MPAAGSGPAVSVVIPTRNRAEDLARVLAAMELQTAPADAFEIIVVDNGSTDGTGDLVESARQRLPNLVAVRDERPGLHVGRHRGLELARAPLLLFGDDDIVPRPTWVSAAAEAFSDDRIGLVTGPCRPDFDVPPPGWYDDLVVRVPGGWFVAEFSVMDLGEDAREISPELVFGCNFGVRRHLVERVGGFHPDGVPSELLRFRGDGETAVARGISDMGYRARYVPGVAVAHRVAAERLSLDYVDRRSFGAGISASFTDIRRRGRVRDRRGMLRHRLGRLRGAFLRSPVVRRRDRWLLAGFRWHQREVARDDALLEWVLADDYRGDFGDLRGKAPAGT